MQNVFLGILEPSKHYALKQCCFNVGPASQTSGQRAANIVSMCRVFWEVSHPVSAKQLYNSCLMLDQRRRR